MNGYEEYPELNNPYDNMGKYDPLSALSLTKHDPIHAMLVKRKQQRDNGEEPILPAVEYKNEDVKALEEFCNKYGIVAMNFGRMNPQIALKMLKAKMGIQGSPVVKSDKQLLFG